MARTVGDLEGSYFVVSIEVSIAGLFTIKGDLCSL